MFQCCFSLRASFFACCCVCILRPVACRLRPASSARLRVFFNYASIVELKMSVKRPFDDFISLDISSGKAAACATTSGQRKKESMTSRDESGSSRRETSENHAHSIR
jgi:hypothetical protein